MKYFVKAVTTLPIGADLFVSRNRMIKIINELYPELPNSKLDKIEEKFKIICRLFGCSTYAYNEGQVVGVVVRKDFSEGTNGLKMEMKEINDLLKRSSD